MLFSLYYNKIIVKNPTFLEFLVNLQKYIIFQKNSKGFNEF